MRGPKLTASRILVVDGCSVVRAGVRGLLREMDISVVEEAENGAEAIDKLGYFPADLVICDLGMAPVDGIAFTRSVRNDKDSPNPFVPIIMMTGDGDKKQFSAAVSAGVNDFAAKPLDKSKLRRQIITNLSGPAVFIREGGSLRPERRPAVNLEAATRGPERLGNLKVLIVDDSAAVRKLIRGMLLDLGVTDSAQAIDGWQAIEILRDYPADLVLCDQHMAPINGVDFTKKVRNSDDSRNPYVPIIMVSGDATEETMASAAAAGVNDFIAKPMTSSTLFNHISTILADPPVFVREGTGMRPERCGPRALSTAI